MNDIGEAIGLSLFALACVAAPVIVYLLVLRARWRIVGERARIDHGAGGARA